MCCLYEDESDCRVKTLARLAQQRVPPVVGINEYPAIKTMN